jgi:hypothetical protein
MATSNAVETEWKPSIRIRQYLCKDIVFVMLKHSPDISMGVACLCKKSSDAILATRYGQASSGSVQHAS